MVLVSGSTGMLGTHLLKQLCCFDEYTIKALYRTNTKRQKTLFILNALVPDECKHNIARIEWVKTDILDLFELNQAFEGISHVYHCAAWVGNSSQDYTLMRKINIRGTANMVNLALSHNVDKFCHVSSIATLGRYTNNRPIDEEAIRETDHHRSLYSITKYGAEMEVWRASQEGLKMLIVNPGVILSAGFFESGSGLLFSKILNNFKFYPPKHTGFVYVDDVVHAMLTGMRSEISNERYILVAENLSFKTVMTYIAKVFKTKRPTLKATKLLLYVAWAIQSLINIFKPLKTRITKDTIMLIDTKFKYENTKSVNDLNVHYTTIENAILKIYNDYTLLNSQA